MRYKSGLGTSNPNWAGVEGIVEETSAGSTVRVKITKDNAASRDMGFHNGGFVRSLTTNFELREPEIKAGDRVEILYAGWEGQKGKVRKQDGVYYYIDLDQGGYLVLLPREFKLITEPETPKLEDFKPGMKVKITGFSPATDGKIGTVDRNTGKYVVVLVEIAGTKQREYLLPSEMEIVEEKETVVTEEAIKVGDTVQVDMHAPKSSFHGVEAVVISASTKNSGRVRITKVTDKALSYVSVGSEHHLYNLTKVAPFTFKDIQKGDTVRRTTRFSNGTTVTKEGTVKNLSGQSANDGGITLAYASDTYDEKITLELVKRPEPKTWAQEKPVGSVFLAETGSSTFAAAITKKGDNEWQRRFLCNNNKQTLTDEKVFTIYKAKDLNWIR